MHTFSYQPLTPHDQFSVSSVIFFFLLLFVVILVFLVVDFVCLEMQEMHIHVAWSRTKGLLIINVCFSFYVDVYLFLSLSLSLSLTHTLTHKHIKDNLWMIHKTWTRSAVYIYILFLICCNKQKKNISCT